MMSRLQKRCGYCFQLSMLLILLSLPSFADSGASSTSSDTGSTTSPSILINLSEAFLRSLLLPDNEDGQSESFVTYIQGVLTDRYASDLSFNRLDLQNLLQMFDQSDLMMSFVVAKTRDKIFQGYVDPDYPDDRYFLYEVNRALMSASQTVLGTYSTDQTYSPGSSASDVEIIRYKPATASESLNYVVASTPTNSYSRNDQDVVVKFGLASKVPGSPYEKISDLLNKVDYALFTSVDCSADFLENECIPCKKQKNTPHYSAVMYKGIKNSSCTMRKEYRDEPWNGMGAFIASLQDIDNTMKNYDFQQAMPSSVLTSGQYRAYSNGVSCLIGDLAALYESRGNWYNFFHWSNFTENIDCQKLMSSAGLTVKTNNQQGIISLIYTYFFDSGNTISDESLTIDGLNVVNTIDGYVKNGSSSVRLPGDPTRSLMQALTVVMYRYRLLLQAQASRAAVDLNQDLSINSSSKQPLIPDEVYLLSFYIKNYASQSFSRDPQCRYQALSSQLSYAPTDGSQAFSSMQKSVMLDMVGQSALTSPLVGFQIPLPDPQTLTLNETEIATSKQVQFLKYGRYALAARYRKTTDGKIYEGVLSDPDSGEVEVPFNVAQMTAQIQDNQKDARNQINKQIKTYNRNMNSLIMKRMMLAYVYEYLAISTMGSWSDNQSSVSSVCPLSGSEQLKISSTWRTDLKNSTLEKLIAQQPAYATQTAPIDLSIQYAQSMTQWDSLETLRDEAFQLAKTNYLSFLEYKINEMMLVFRTALIVQGMQNSLLMQKGFPAMYDSNDKNQKTYALVNTLPDSGSGSSTASDGSVDPDAAMQDAGVPNPQTDAMAKDTAYQGCCKNE